MAVSYNKLWKLLIDKNMKKKELGEAAGISNTLIAKLGKNEITTITIPNACFDRNNEYGTSSGYDETIHTNFGDVDENGNQRQYNKTANTAKDTAFNVIVVDRQNRKIHCFNYGAGIDREISY